MSLARSHIPAKVAAAVSIKKDKTTLPLTTSTAKTGSRWLRWSNCWPPLAYLLLTLILTWPLALHLSDGIVHFVASDHYQNLWNIWWFRTALFEQHHNPFYTDVLFYPYRASQHPLELYFHTLQPAFMLLASPLSYLIGIVSSYNLLVLLSFVISGWGMYFLARYFTQNTAAAFVAGALFDFCAYHFNILSVGQTNLLPTGTIPLFILFLHKSVAPLQPSTEKSHSWLYPSLAIIVLTVASYIDWYYPLYMLMYMGGLLLVVLVRQPRQWRSTFIRFGAIGLGWLVLAGPLLFLTLRATSDPDIKFKANLEFEVIHSAALFSLFTPLKDMRIAPGAWQQAFFGYTTSVLAIIGLWLGRKQRSWWLWWLGLVVVFSILSLGPYLRLSQTDNTTTAVTQGLPLPYLWLQNLPLISFSRSPNRFQVIVEMALSMLAAFGLSGLLDVIENWSRFGQKIRSSLKLALPLLVLAIFGLEMQTLPWPLEKMDRPPIFEQIAQEPGNFAVMELPITGHGVEDARRMYYQTIHHRPIAGGYIARTLTDYYRGDATAFDDYFDRINHLTYVIVNPDNRNDAPLRLLNVYNFRYLIMYKDEYRNGDIIYTNGGQDPAGDEVWHQNYKYILNLLGAANQIYQDSNITVFRIPQAPATTKPIIYSLVNWYNLESPAKQAPYQWAKADPTLIGTNAQAQKVQLKLTAWAFQPDSKFSVQVNGQEVAQLTLTATPTNYITPEFNLPQGDFKLVLHNLTQPTSPHSLDPKSNDERDLTLAASYIEVAPVK